MDPRKLFYDDRLKTCVHCGSAPEDGDHVPSKVLLDQPYPPNLPVVSSCRSCNNSFSADEPYLACMIDCAASDAEEAGHVPRDRVRRLLVERRELAHEIEALRATDSLNRLICDLSNPRVANVVLKLARGHIAFECGELVLQPPHVLSAVLLEEMTRSDRAAFETEPEPSIFPEIGSRAFLAMATAGGFAAAAPGWNIVQAGRYRYLVSWGKGLSVRMVLSEYLACVAAW